MEQINKYQKDILKKYKKYRLSTKKSSFKQICFPKTYTPQIQQLFVSKFINPNTNNKNILLYHKIGAGKTCAAIKIAEEWKEKRDIIFVCPASLIGGFYKELCSECTNTTYISNIERKQLNTLDVLSIEYKKLIKTINNRIDKYYQVYSYNKFIDLLNKKKIKLNNTLLIIDEVQNIVSEHGSYYKTIYKAIMNAPTDLRLVIMTATPIFDKPMELGLTLNLLRPKKLFPIGNNFNEEYIDYKVIDNKPYYDIKNIKDLQLKLNGLVSYYPGSASYVFPTRIQKIIKCPMSKYQYECYKVVQEREGEINKLDLLKLPNNFFIGSRIISNIAFPNKLVNQLGLNALTPRLMNLDNLKTYSTKFYYIMKKILKTSGTVFLYSNFKEYGGILTFIKILEHYKFKNFHKEGSGKNRYAIWSGDETLEQKEKLRNVFNNILNINGSKIKIVLGSPAIKEGVNLLRVRQVHILEPYWNISRLEQVIGRAVRFCSHKDVNLEKRYVKVFIYIATIPTELNKTEMLKQKEDRIITVDEHIYNMAIAKQKLSDKFEDVIKRSSIDYNLFQNIKN